MDTVFQALLSWQLLLACLAIAAATFVFRKVIEYLMETHLNFQKSSKLWTDLVLPIFPMTFGCLSALFAKGLPFPDGITTGSARFACGLVAGLLSGLVYRVIKSFLASKVGLQADDNESNLIDQVRGSINKE
jgi:hypothetical protein